MHRRSWACGLASPGAAPVWVALLGTLVGSCGPGSSRSDLPPEERARAVKIGAEAADALQATLGSHLVAALERGGPAHAITFCAGRAQELTDSVSRRLSDGVRVGRVSLRARNPSDLPDAVDREVLVGFDDASRAGTVLSSEEIRVAGPGEVRYYRPLVVTHVCLGCHGPVEALEPDVRDILRVRYPADAAVGYEVGEVRGAVRVRIPTSAIRP